MAKPLIASLAPRWTPLKSRAFSIWFRFAKNAAAFCCRPRFLSSPRRRGPITTGGFDIHSRCNIALLRRMGPRLRGDDSGEASARGIHSSSVRFTCSHLRQPEPWSAPVNRVKLRSSPVLCLGAGVRPSSAFLTAPQIEGDGAPTRRSAWITPGDVRLRPDHGARLWCVQRCTRASRRANAASWLIVFDGGRTGPAP